MGLSERSLRLNQEAFAADNPYGLTHVELEIVQLLRRGISEPGARTALNIDRALFGQHTASIRCKMGAQNAAHLHHLISTLPQPPGELVYLDDIVVDRRRIPFRRLLQDNDRAVSDDIVFVD